MVKDQRSHALPDDDRFDELGSENRVLPVSVEKLLPVGVLDQRTHSREADVVKDGRKVDITAGLAIQVQFT